MGSVARADPATAAPTSSPRRETPSPRRRRSRSTRRTSPVGRSTTSARASDASGRRGAHTLTPRACIVGRGHDLERAGDGGRARHGGHPARVAAQHGEQAERPPADAEEVLARAAPDDLARHPVGAELRRGEARHALLLEQPDVGEVGAVLDERDEDVLGAEGLHGPGAEVADRRGQRPGRHVQHREGALGEQVARVRARHPRGAPARRTGRARGRRRRAPRAARAPPTTPPAPRRRSRGRCVS